MPAPLAVDKEQVRMLVLNVGVREAARQCGIDEDTVKSWSRRGKWLDACKPQQALPLSIRPRQLAPDAPTPADALANTLADDSKVSRIAASQFARRTLTKAAQIAQDDPEAALALSRPVKEITSVAATVHGWSGEAGSVRISVFGGPQPVEIEAEVVRLDEHGESQ